jgi:hypothetical protein
MGYPAMSSDWRNLRLSVHASLKRSRNIQTFDMEYIAAKHSEKHNVRNTKHLINGVTVEG